MMIIDYLCYLIGMAVTKPCPLIRLFELNRESGKYIYIGQTSQALSGRSNPLYREQIEIM